MPQPSPNPSNSSATDSTPAAAVRLPHPRGLYPMFFTEMWERFSYYGMRALLVLFLVDTVRGGKGLSDATAAAIYGLYTASVYLVALPGGWVADRFLGAQRSVWYGGIVILLGHLTLALAHGEGFYLGLVLIVVGTGLLKPNVSVIIGELYPEGGSRRDAGFTIFYMGVNLGAVIGPLVASSLGEKYNWHYGFGAAGVGMFFGLVQFYACMKLGYLGEKGLHPGHRGKATPKDWILLLGMLGGLTLLIVLAWTGVIPIVPQNLTKFAAYIIAGTAVVYFVAAFLFFGLDEIEKKRLMVIALLFVASAMFWSGFEQAGSSFTLFAERFTQRTFGHFTIPTGWFQTINPIFIITLAPVVAMIWVALARRNRDLALGTKFSLGLFLLAGGFLVLTAAAAIVGRGEKVLPTWLIATYLIHSIGELCLSPVGLSSVTKLAPRRLVGQMMGLWFLASSLGNLIAGAIAGESSTPAQMIRCYTQVIIMSVIVGAVLLCFHKPIKNAMKGID